MSKILKAFFVSTCIGIVLIAIIKFSLPNNGFTISDYELKFLLLLFLYFIVCLAFLFLRDYNAWGKGMLISIVVLLVLGFIVWTNLL